MQRTFKVTVDGNEYIVEVEEIKNKPKTAEEKIQKQPSSQQQGQVQKKQNESAEKFENKEDKEKNRKPKTLSKEKDTSEVNEVTSPMTGVVLDIFVSSGDRISRGDKVILMEAMKMENTVLSDYDGTVKEVKVKKGDNIDAGDVIVVLE
ncbi:MAG: biotin/lipoyl-containing protein [Kosmotogaceae bacterium]